MARVRSWFLASLLCAGCVRDVPAISDTPPDPLTLEQLLALRTPSGVQPAFPPSCQRRGRIAFMAVGELLSLDVNALAERYRRVYGVPVEVLPPLPSEEIAAAFVGDRGQYESSALIGLIAAKRGKQPWIIGVTDDDLFWAARRWNFVFSTWSDGIALVSTARTEPPGPESAQRTFKLITRVLAETWCELERDGPTNSVLAPTLMGLSDLDRIDESVWERGPTRL